MTAPITLRHDRRGTKAGYRGFLVLLGVAVFLLLACAVWVGVRGIMAKNELESAVPLAALLKNQVFDQDTEQINETAARLDRHAQEATALTSDPIWLLGELVPWLGPNLTAVRELAEVIERLSHDAVVPMASLGSTIETGDFRPVDGVLDPQPLIDARPTIERVVAAVDAAETSLAMIDTDGTIEPIRSAKAMLRDQVATLGPPVRAVRTAVVLLPDMLGASGRRDFLLLFQNPSELRASGGIPGALALISTDAGRIDLVQQASTADFPRYKSPVLPLRQETRGLYGDITGEFMQNVNLTPQFPESASLAREMWKREFGQEVSGVLSIDPVALSYVLEATGPVTLVTGDVLSADNAVTLLLSDAYARYSKPADQDRFFAAAASAVFERVSAGALDPVKLIAAFARAGDERRISIWSAIHAEQDELLTTGLAGVLRQESAEVQPFGVFFNDATASKMDFYLDAEIEAGQVTCRRDGRPNYGIAVKLTNLVPEEAAATLPNYVTGGGAFGVTPGNIKTLVNVYGSPELQNLGVTRDGVSVPFLPARDSGHQVSQIAVELAPGESATLLFGFLGEAPFDGKISIDQTPVINLRETKKLALSCESPLW